MHFPHPKTVVISNIQHLPLFKNKFFLEQKYVAEGLSIAQIAALISSSKEAVRNGLTRFGIPIRQAHKSHGRIAQPQYGQKTWRGKASLHQTEQKVIRAIQEMRGQGLSLRQIAKVLDQMKVPTKCQGRSWHPQMVKRALDYARASLENSEIETQEEVSHGTGTRNSYRRRK